MAIGAIFTPFCLKYATPPPLPLFLAYSAIVIIVSESLHFARRNLTQLSTEWKYGSRISFIFLYASPHF